MTASSFPPSARHGDAGSITPLVLGLAVVLLLIISVVVTASQAFLHRRALSALADGAAVAAAQEIAHEQVYTDGLGEQLPITPAAASAAAARYLASVDVDPDLHDVTITDVRVEGDAVLVRIDARAQVDLPSPVTAPWSGGIPVAASSRASVYVS
jgi:hypothetical protein